MAITTYAGMQIVPEKFSEYTLNRTTELNRFVNSGIAVNDAIVAQLINGTPQGGRFIMLPQYNALEGDDDVFGESSVTVENITTSAAHATLLMRQKAWGATDLASVLGGSDPMGAVAQMLADWWNTKEQAIYLSILKGVLDPTKGALKAHVNDVSASSGDAGKISVGNTLDTKQKLGDHFDSLGMVFMHSATYTQLQKNQQIQTEYDATLQIKIDTYLGYRVVIDDAMPYVAYDTCQSSATGALKVVGKDAEVGDGEISISTRGLPDGVAAGDYVKAKEDIVYTTYFLGSGAFIRQDGVPQGFVGTETDRDTLTAIDYLINRRCMVIHPKGLSWNTAAVYPSGIYHPTNAMLATPTNWSLVVNPKKVPMAALVHKL